MKSSYRLALSSASSAGSAPGDADEGSANTRKRKSGRETNRAPSLGLPVASSTSREKPKMLKNWKRLTPTLALGAVSSIPKARSNADQTPASFHLANACLTVCASASLRAGRGGEREAGSRAAWMRGRAARAGGRSDAGQRSLPS